MNGEGIKKTDKAARTTPHRLICLSAEYFQIRDKYVIITVTFLHFSNLIVERVVKM